MKRVFGVSDGLRQNLLGPSVAATQDDANTRRAEFTRKTRPQQRKDTKSASIEIPNLVEASTFSSATSNISTYDIVEWDMCLIVPNPGFKGSDGSEPKSVQLHHKDIIERLLLGGLVTYQFYSGDTDEIIIKIGCPVSRLRKRAEEVNITFLLSEKYLEEKIDTKHPIGNDAAITTLMPYQYIFYKYNDERAAMFAKSPGYNHPFSSMIRTKLIYSIVTSDEVNCCGLSIRRLLIDSKGLKDFNDSVRAFYPLHNDAERESIWKSFSDYRVQSWNLPFDDIRNYFGEKVALYFVFNGHMAVWLRPLAVFGFIVSLTWAIEIAYFGDVEMAFSAVYATPAFCVFVSLWSQFLIEYWKRKEKRTAMEWGMSKFEEVEINRSEYEGTIPVKSPIDGSDSFWDPPEVVFKKQLYSYSIITSAMLGVIVCVSVIFYLQFIVNSRTSGDVQSYLGSLVTILSAVQIIVLEYLYTGLAISLNDQENHRTDTMYEDALISKMFVFSFVNSYASLFFVAFIKTYIGESCTGGCFSELSYQLTTIFASKLTVAKISSYFTLVVNRKLKDREVQKEYEEHKLRLQREKNTENVYIPEVSKAEKEGEFIDYDPALGVLQDYSKCFIQFGFLTLFVAACPLAPALAYISIWIDMRTDAWKLLYMTKRVIPFGAQDVGTWQTILELIAFISVSTNAAILCFTMNVLHVKGPTSVWLFIAFQYFVFIIMFVSERIVDDVPLEVQIQLQRQDHLHELITGQDDDGKLESKVALTHISEDKYQIHKEDFSGRRV